MSTNGHPEGAGRTSARTRGPPGGTTSEGRAPTSHPLGSRVLAEPPPGLRPGERPGGGAGDSMEGEAGLDPRAQPYDNVIQNPKREGMVSSPNNGRSGDDLVRGVSGAAGRRRRARPVCPCRDTGCCQKSSCHDMGILWSGGAVYDPAGLLTDFLFCRFRFPHWVTLLREARPRKWAPGGSSRGARRRTDSPPSSGVDPLVEQNTHRL